MQTAVPTKIESVANQYALLAIERSKIEAQMSGLKPLLVKSLGEGGDIVGDNYVITIAKGRPSEIWTDEEVKKNIKASLVEKGIIKVTYGKPYPTIRFIGDNNHE